MAMLRQRAEDVKSFGTMIIASGVHADAASVIARLDLFKWRLEAQHFSWQLMNRSAFLSKAARSVAWGASSTAPARPS